MPLPAPLCPPIEPSRLRPVATARVLYADTDKMGIAYHAAYFRYLELARVELIRAAGIPYTELEDAGLALPLSETSVRYHAPALYDDLMTIEIGLTLLTRVRVHFEYRVRVLAGDRRGLEEDLDLLSAQTRHACVRREDGRPERLPLPVFDVLRACVNAPHNAGL